MQMTISFVTLPSAEPSLLVDLQAGSYRSGTPESPDAIGEFTVGAYELTLPVELKLSFLEAQSPPLPAGFNGESLLLAMCDQFFVSQGSVAGGVPVTPDPPYAIGFVTPGTSGDSRLNSLILNEAVI
jgi:hypothetical protein